MLSNDIDRTERREIVQSVEDQIHELLDRREEAEPTRESVLAVPIEALTIRDPDAEEALSKRRGGRGRRSREADPESGDSDGSQEKEGAFLVTDGVVRFAQITTGIAGEKHFEVLAGVEEGDRIVRGPFEALRHLHSGDKVKIKGDRRKRKDRREESEADDPGGGSS